MNAHAIVNIYDIERSLTFMQTIMNVLIDVERSLNVIDQSEMEAMNFRSSINLN